MSLLFSQMKKSCLAQFGHVGGNLWSRQVVGLQEFVKVVAVGKSLVGAVAAHFHGAVAIESGYFFAPSAVYGAVFQRDDYLVVGLQAVEQLLVVV